MDPVCIVQSPLYVNLKHISLIATPIIYLIFFNQSHTKFTVKDFFFKLQFFLGERSDDTPIQVRKFLLFRIQKVLISIYIYLSPFARKFTSIYIYFPLQGIHGV
jgi:hypothetical protein